MSADSNGIDVQLVFTSDQTGSVLDTIAKIMLVSKR